jgi:hypothetical protein
MRKLTILATLLSAASLTFTPSGTPVTVWAAVETLRKCKEIDVPDIPARAWLSPDGATRMIVGSTNYHRMYGSSLLNLTRDCKVSWNETGDADPSHFAGDEFLDSPWAFANGTVYSLIHTEYPGNIYHNCTGPAYPHCWMVSIGLGVSHDNGVTWAHARPAPNHLVAAVPYVYNQSQLAYGWGDPSNIVAHSGFFYAALWNRNQVGLQAPGVCIVRTNDLSDPASWRAWDGSAYTRTFVSPYAMLPGEAAEHVCVVTNAPTTGPFGGLAWSTTLSKWVATQAPDAEHFYVLTSDDLITWSDPVLLYAQSMLPPAVAKNVTSMSYPTFMDPSMGDNNFATIGTDPLLFWVSIGHSPYTDGRRLWATPFHVN